MKPCKRLEIIIEQPLARSVIAFLDECDVSGYTLVPGVSGRGGRGERRNDDPTGTFTNCIIIVMCDDAEQASRIVDGIRPLLTRSGGLCLVTDAWSVKH